MAFPLPTNMTGNITAIAYYSNDVTGGMFWTVMLLALVMAILGILIKSGNTFMASTTLSCFLGVIISGMMLMLNLVAWTWILIFLIGTGVGAFMLWTRE